MKELALSQGKVALIDDEDFEYLNQWKWHVSRNWNTFYVVRMTPHREILQAPKGIIVDHINGDGLDNRRENLRFATNSENMQNSRLQKNNTSGYKGVYWDRGRNKWIVRIKVNGRRLNLGYFDDPKEAALVYDRGAMEHFGEFAKTNF